MTQEDHKPKGQLGVETHVDMGSILSLRLEALVKTEPLFGLTDQEVLDRLEQFGHNGMFRMMH